MSTFPDKPPDSRNYSGTNPNTFFDLADRQNEYFNTFFTRVVTPYRLYQKNDPFYLPFGFLHLTQVDVKNQTHKVNREKMLHTVHNYLFVQHHFHRTNPLIHMKSRLQYADTKLTSPYYINYSYIIQPNYCKCTLRIFEPIKKYFLFLPPYANTNRPILVPLEYTQCLERGTTKCMCDHTFNLLYRDWMTDNLDNREPSAEDTEMLNHLFALQSHCNVDLFPRDLAACLTGDQDFWEFFGDPDNRALTLKLKIGRRPQSYIIGLTVP